MQRADRLDRLDRRPSGCDRRHGRRPARPADRLATVPGSVAEILPDGLAVAPADAPTVVREVIAAGNQLIGKPYVYGGGHASFISAGYDCSGAVSYALHGGGLLSSPLDSTRVRELGRSRAPGTWITVFTNPRTPTWTIAGIRLDTSTAGDPGGRAARAGGRCSALRTAASSQRPSCGVLSSRALRLMANPTRRNQCRA